MSQKCLDEKEKILACCIKCGLKATTKNPLRNFTPGRGITEYTVDLANQLWNTRKQKPFSPGDKLCNVDFAILDKEKKHRKNLISNNINNQTLQLSNKELKIEEKITNL